MENLNRLIFIPGDTKNQPKGIQSITNLFHFYLEKHRKCIYRKQNSKKDNNLNNILKLL